MNGETSHDFRYQKMSSHQRLDASRKLSRKSVQTILATVCVSLSVAVVLLGVCVIWIYFRLVSLETEVSELKVARCRPQREFPGIPIGGRLGVNKMNNLEENTAISHEPPNSSDQKLPWGVYGRPFVESSDSANVKDHQQAQTHVRGKTGVRRRGRHLELLIRSRSAREVHLAPDTMKGAVSGSRETGNSSNLLPQICNSICEAKGQKAGTPLKGNKKRNKKFVTTNFEGLLEEDRVFNGHHSNENCAPHPDWDKTILVCKEDYVKITNKGTKLPFYKEINNLASKEKKLKNEQILQDSVAGVFNVKITGYYLIHMNITVDDRNGTHFLALFVNDRATLACPGGGFPCPIYNTWGRIQYRICNIGGLLELNVGDRVDIRTMTPDMSVRLETPLRSYLRFVHLR